MKLHPKPLFDMLLALYRTNDDLYEFLANYEYVRRGDLINSLPATSVSRTFFTLRVVEQIQAHGLDNLKLFEFLAERFPGRTDLIEAVKRDYLGELNSTSALSDDIAVPVLDTLPLPSKDLTTKFEKIIGDRPTFLDVSYLAIGYERAKSVAKLRMRFAESWYSGTAFLVKPDTLLTAHHNLWMRDKPADEVEVIFDYQRSVEGFDLESVLCSPEPHSFVGDAKDDWAMFKLKEPQTTRPLAPLSDKKANIGDRVAIIQHPNGMPKQVALHHNLVTFVNDARIQYLTDTNPGSSGSPVFDSHWNVIGVHHMGGELRIPGQKQVAYRNQGIAISLLRAALATRGTEL